MRALSGEAWARVQEGDAREAVELLLVARELAEGPQFSDIDRADLLFRLGVCRYKLSSIATAVALFDEALALAGRSGLPCDLLRADILGWRSRCRRRQRDFEAAREDVEAALELAQGMDDRRVVANTYFQAHSSPSGWGTGSCRATTPSRPRALYQELNDERNVGRLMLNLGGLQLAARQAASRRSTTSRRRSRWPSRPTRSRTRRRRSGASRRCTCTSRTTTQPTRTRARRLQLLEGREDFLDEVGQSQLVLGRALLERGRLDEAEECFAAADAVFEQMASVGHRAGAWVARGDLASRRGDDREAARWYRNAAEALQDIRF